MFLVKAIMNWFTKNFNLSRPRGPISRRCCMFKSMSQFLSSSEEYQFFFDDYDGYSGFSNSSYSSSGSESSSSSSSSLSSFFSVLFYVFVVISNIIPPFCSFEIYFSFKGGIFFNYYPLIYSPIPISSVLSLLCSSSLIALSTLYCGLSYFNTSFSFL